MIQISDVVATGVLNITTQIDTGSLDKALASTNNTIVQSSSKAADSVSNSFDRMFKNVTGQSTTFGSTVSRNITKSFEAITSSVKAFATVGAASIAAVTTETIRLGVEVNNASAKATLFFDAFTGNVAKTQALLGSLNKISDNNPLIGKESLFAGAQQLAASGSPLSKIPDTLNAIAKAEFAVGGGAPQVNSIVSTLSRVYTTGQLSTRQFIALKNSGIDAAAVISRQLGISVDAFQAKLKSGQITGRQAADALVAGLTKQFGAIDATIGKTLPQSTAIFKNSLSELGASLTKVFVSPSGGGASVNLFNDLAASVRHVTEIAGPLQQLLAPIADGITKFGDSIKNAIDSVTVKNVQSFVDAIKSLLPALAALAGFGAGKLTGLLGGILPAGLAEKLPLLAEGINPVIAALAAFALVIPSVRSQLAQLGNDIATVFKPSLDTIIPIVHDLQAVFVSFASGFASGFVGFFTTLAPIVAAIITPFVQAQKAVADFASALGVFKPLGDVFGVITASIVTYTVVTKIAEAATVAFGVATEAVAIIVGTYETAVAAVTLAIEAMASGEGALTAITAALDAALLANPIGLIIAAVAALVVGIIAAYEHFKTFRDVINEIGSFIKGVFIGAINAAEAAFGPLKSAFEAIVNAGKSIYDALFPIRGVILVPLIAAFAPLILTILALVEAFRILPGVISTVVSAVGGFFSSIANSDFVKTAINDIVKAFNTVKDIVVSVGSFVAKVFGGIVGFIKDIVGHITDFIGKAKDLPLVQKGFQLIQDVVKELNKILDATIGKIENVVGGILRLGSKVLSAVGIDVGGGGAKKPAAPNAPPPAAADTTGIDTALANTLEQAQGLQQAIEAAVKPIDEIISAQNAVREATLRVKDAQFSLNLLTIQRNQLLADTVSKEDEILQANFKVIDAKRALTDLDVQRDIAVHDEQERIRKFAEDQTGFSDKVLQNQIDQRKVALDLVDAQRQLSFLQRQASFGPTGLNLAGLSLDEARQRIAAATSTLQNQRTNVQQGTLARQITEQQDAVTSAQIKQRDTQKQQNDLTVENNNAIFQNQVATAKFQQDTTKFDEDKQKANESVAVAVNEQNKLLSGQIGFQKTLRDLDHQIDISTRSVTEARNAQLQASDTLTADYAKQSGDAGSIASSQAQLLKDKLQQAAPGGPDDKLLALYKQQLSTIQGIGAAQKINAATQDQITAGAAVFTDELKNASNPDLRRTPQVRASELANLTNVLTTQLGQFFISTNGQPITADTFKSFAQDALNELLSNPSTPLNQIISDILKQLNLQLPGFAEGGIFNTETIARIGEAGREVVLPLTRQARLQDLLGNPDVLNPILAALPRMSLPGKMKLDASTLNGVSYGQGGPSNANARIDIEHNEDRMARKIAKALADEMQQRQLGNVKIDAPVTVTPHRLQSESDIANAVAREILRKLR